ncbi:MAG: hypothetical protein HQL54_07755 [Magnetococcales bacterium]|nr:hypothetical protein [Magnetococcales bacterium]
MIESTQFGKITIDGQTFQHDVVIRLDGTIIKRPKKLSKEIYGTSHTLSESELKAVFESGCETLIIGTGQYGRVVLSTEAQAFLNEKRCKAILEPTPKAIARYNKHNTATIGLFHLTC